MVIGQPRGFGQMVIAIYLFLLFVFLSAGVISMAAWLGMALDE